MKKIDISRLSDDHIMQRLSPADWAQVLDIMEDNPLYYEHSGKQPTRGQIFQDMAALPDGKTAADKYYLGYFERQYLVAVLDLIDGWPDADTAYIGFFMVDGCMQGEGLGTALMEQLCLYCGELGYRRVMLGWDKGNPQAEHFWRKLDFEPVKESGRYIVAERLLPAPKEEGSFESCLLTEAAQHPLMKARDALKMCYQAARGAEHGIKDANAARKYLRDEIKAVEADEEALFYAPISPELCRVDLRAWKARGLKWQWLYNMFEKCRGDGLMDEKLAAVEHLAAEGKLPFTAEEWKAELSAWDGEAVSHSAAYREAYAPAYRIVPMKYICCFPILEKMAEHPDGCVVAIDGMSNSGKSTIGNLLTEVTEAGLVRMDDILTPAGRMQVVSKGWPGGNVNYAMFQRDILPNLSSEKAFSYPYFANHSLVLNRKRRVRRSPWRIVEGSYSQHVVFGDYADVKVFVRCARPTQRSRVVARDGVRLAPSYFRIWIPQEDEYFEFFRLWEKADVLIET